MFSRNCPIFVSAMAFAFFSLVCPAFVGRGIVEAAPPKLASAAPADVGLDADHLKFIDVEVAREIDAGKLPGCVVLISRQGRVAFLKAYGQKQILPERAPMTTDTLFDLASITKPVATATSIMVLVQRGRLQIRDRVAAHLPEFGQNGKDKITVLQLLTHQSGLIPDNDLDDYAGGHDRAFERIFALRTMVEPGSQFLYSDVGYIVLGALVERLSGKNIHEFSRDEIFAPLGMTETGYLPSAPLRARAAPTEKRGDHWIQGEVHDPRAHQLGGIAGHAGLFSTATDLAVYARMLVNRGEYGAVRVLAPRTVDLMSRPVPVPSGLRALGWDVRTGYSINRGELMSASAFGHGGFTGTGMWIDPELDLVVIFLSNRVHPDGKGQVNPLIGRIGSIAAAAIEKAPITRTEAASP
jgi:CubicO group peptidase (beta-lactamase class C family)